VKNWLGEAKRRAAEGVSETGIESHLRMGGAFVLLEFTPQS